MKIYFSASVSNMDDHFRDNYILIVNILEKLGHKVIADHVLKKTPESFKTQTEKDRLDIQSKLTAWKKQADLVVVEVSNPSLGVGQEIAVALANNKPVICLYENGKEPHLLRDGGGELLFISSYIKSSLKEVITDLIEYAAEKQDTRFNFFISPKIGNYLDWISNKKRVPRAVYLRRLIEEEIKKNKEYEE